MAASAYRRQHPQGALANMGARLAAYRQTSRDDTGADALPIEPGVCRNGRSSRAAAQRR